ncbi:MAG: branched-chain amino acid ABC transporter permease [Solirubrobacterales bacterium]|nr:branched-chain amino acid ABC transporter permease [Solirubrobacterales bacterium]
MSYLRHRVLALETPILLSLILLLVTFVAPSAGLSIENRAIVMLINVALVVGLYSFAGLSGVLTFGHMSFMGIGAYAGALVTIPVVAKGSLLPDLPGFLANAEVSLPIAILIGGGLAALFAAIISLPIARLPGLALSLAMFAVLIICYQVEANWDSLTRGRQALLGVPTNTTIWVALATAIGAMFVVFAYQQSRFGLRLRAAREDEYSAAATGVNIVRERRISLVISGALIGVVGVVYAQYLGVFTPNDFYLDLTFMTIAMLVIGGTRSLTGAVIGPMLVAVLTYTLQQGETVTGPGLQQVGLAIVMVLVLVFRPSGLTNGKELKLSTVVTRFRQGRADRNGRSSETDKAMTAVE